MSCVAPRSSVSLWLPMNISTRCDFALGSHLTIRPTALPCLAVWLATQRNAFLSLHCCYAWRRRFGSRFAGGDGRRDTDLTLTRFSIAIIIVPALSLRGGTASTGNPPHGPRRGHYACPGAQRAQDIIGCACGLGCHLRPEQLQATQVDQEDLPGIYSFLLSCSARLTSTLGVVWLLRIEIRVEALVDWFQTLLLQA